MATSIMFKLFAERGGSQEIELEGPAFSNEDWATLRGTCVSLMFAKELDDAAMQLSAWSFNLMNATNGFGDKFVVLQASLPVREYSELAERIEDRHIFAEIAGVVSEVVGKHVRFIVASLAHGPEHVGEPEIKATAATVELALADARASIREGRASSAVDRVHTAFHGYLRRVCSDRGINVPADAPLTKLFTELRSAPELVISPEATRVLKSMASAVDAINTVRNNASLAHPNEELLDEPEAMLVINATRTMLNYLEARLKPQPDMHRRSLV